MSILEKESAKALYILFDSLSKAAKEAFIVEFTQKVLEKKALIENGKITLMKADEIVNEEIDEDGLYDDLDLDEDEIGSGD